MARKTVIRRAGSSPHTRGARARRSSWPTSARDHPRIRGEHPELPEALRDGDGIIPAYAGSTEAHLRQRTPFEGSSPHTRGARFSAGSPRPPRWDHPRIRGEHHHQSHYSTAGDGIIPAYAGSTQRAQPLQPERQGSSPHTRGAHLLTSGSLPKHLDFNSLSFSQKPRSQSKKPAPETPPATNFIRHISAHGGACSRCSTPPLAHPSAWSPQSPLAGGSVPAHPRRQAPNQVGEP